MVLVPRSCSVLIASVCRRQRLGSLSRVSSAVGIGNGDRPRRWWSWRDTSRDRIEVGVRQLFGRHGRPFRVPRFRVLRKAINLGRCSRIRHWLAPIIPPLVSNRVTTEGRPLVVEGAPPYLPLNATPRGAR